MGWIRGATIGRGSHGTVSLAIPTSSTSSNSTQLFVVKSSEISNSDSLRNEKQVLNQLGNNHPHIIQFLGDSSSYEDGTLLYNLFFEYASNGSLSDHFKLVNEVELSKVKKYTKGILEGLCYIHEKGYVHSDIKLQNILLCSDNVVKISDFGLSKRVYSDDEVGMFRGTPLYMSPEILAGGEVGSPSDVWALGCAVVEMISGATVWRISPESDVSALFYRVGVAGESPVLPQGLCCEGADFVQKCFVKDPNERWTARMLLTHPFLSGLTDPCCCGGGGGEVGSVSPRCPFEFPEMESGPDSGSGLGLGLGLDLFGCTDVVESRDWGSVLGRFENDLVNDRVRPDWDDTDGWVNVR